MHPLDYAGLQLKNIHEVCMIVLTVQTAVHHIFDGTDRSNFDIPVTIYVNQESFQ